MPDGRTNIAPVLVRGSLESKIESDLVRSESHPWGFKFSGAYLTVCQKFKVPGNKKAKLRFRPSSHS